MKGIIISATSDIATEMCLQWKKKNWNLCGTYFSQEKNYKLLNESAIPLIHCDLSKASSVDNAANEIGKKMKAWDFLLFATGSQVPVGPFEKVDIDLWTTSLQINFLNQLRLLHQLLPFRSSAVEKTVLF